MRVGIDYTSAATQREGIGRATRELVGAMLRLPDCPELHLVYAHRGPVPEADALAVNERVRVRRLPLSPRVMLAGWYKARLPLPIEALLGPLHVMHGPDFVLPPRLAAAGVVTVHDLAFVTRPEDAHPAQRRFLESAVPLSIDRARLVVAVSETTRQDLMTRYGVRPHRIRVVPNAVSAEFHERDGDDELAEVRRRLRLPEDYLLSVGTIHPRKNLGGLARAAASSARQLGRALPVLHVGREGWLCERVFADVATAGPPGIRFVGQIRRRHAARALSPGGGAGVSELRGGIRPPHPGGIRLRHAGRHVERLRDARGCRRRGRAGGPARFRLDRRRHRARGGRRRSARGAGG